MTHEILYKTEKKRFIFLFFFSPHVAESRLALTMSTPRNDSGSRHLASTSPVRTSSLLLSHGENHLREQSQTRLDVFSFNMTSCGERKKSRMNDD
jgi:hypothetical protein